MRPSCHDSLWNRHATAYPTSKGGSTYVFKAIYADDAAAGGSLMRLKKIDLLLTTGPVRGYFPEPEKSILVVKPVMVKRAKARFGNLGF